MLLMMMMLMTMPIAHRRGEQPRERIDARRIIARIAHERAKHARARQPSDAFGRRRRRGRGCRRATARRMVMTASRAVTATATDAARGHIESIQIRRCVSRDVYRARDVGRGAKCARARATSRDRVNESQRTRANTYAHHDKHT
jgi:hypothetical protein